MEKQNELLINESKSNNLAVKSNKQIDEMATIICQNTEFDTMWGECYQSAKALYNAGYRKASDVAREIFEEIDKRLEALLKFYPCNGEFEDAKRFVDFHWKHIRHSIMCDYDAELKKKYINK